MTPSPGEWFALWEGGFFVPPFAPQAHFFKRRPVSIADEDDVPRRFKGLQVQFGIAKMPVF